MAVNLSWLISIYSLYTLRGEIFINA